MLIRNNIYRDGREYGFGETKTLYSKIGGNKYTRGLTTGAATAGTRTGCLGHATAAGTGTGLFRGNTTTVGAGTGLFSSHATAAGTRSFGYTTSGTRAGLFDGATTAAGTRAALFPGSNALLVRLFNYTAQMLQLLCDIRVHQ